MKSYSFARMIVDGKETAILDIYREWNTFTIYNNDVCVYRGSWIGTAKYIEDWKLKWRGVYEFLEQNGHFVSFEQNIGFDSER